MAAFLRCASSMRWRRNAGDTHAVGFGVRVGASTSSHGKQGGAAADTDPSRDFRRAGGGCAASGDGRGGRVLAPLLPREMRTGEAAGAACVVA